MQNTKVTGITTSITTTTRGDRQEDKMETNIYGVINSSYFHNKDSEPFINTVYKNFSDLAYDENLKHNTTEIRRLLKSPDFRGLLVFSNGKIVGYLLSEIMNLNDGRRVLFINYIMVGKQYRKGGVGSILLNTMVEFCRKQHIDTVMLVYDTENPEMQSFYEKRGFMSDLVLRRYSRYDVYSKQLV